MKKRILLRSGLVLVFFLTMSGPGASSYAQSIDCFKPDMLQMFLSSDPDQFFGKSLTGSNMDTPIPGEWRISDCKLDPPQGSYLDGVPCPMFEQIIDQRKLKNVRIKASFYTGDGYVTHPGILFRGKDADNFGWLYIRPHWSESNPSRSVVLSSATDGFISPSVGSGPHLEGLFGYVDDVGFNRNVELVVEIRNDKMSVDINGVRRLSDFDIAAAGYAAEGMVGVAMCDNNDPQTVFLNFSVTSLEPVANAGSDQTVEMTSCAGASVALDGSASSDPDGDALTYTWSENGSVIATGVNPTVTLSFGSHTVTLSVDDGKGGTASDDIVINVVDTTAPALNVSLNPSTLWPPNHKYVKVTPTVAVIDACVETTTTKLVSATSSEPDNGLGDGDTAIDIVVNADGTISLRAERSGKGRGRVYTITYQAADSAENTTTESATVTVPHNR